MISILKHNAIVRRLLLPVPIHNQSRLNHRPDCPIEKGSPASGGAEKQTLKRAEPSKVRFGFLPDEWFLFMHDKTGVSGPYLLIFTFSNFLISKEIYVMEHEYYLGLSLLVMAIGATKKMGPGVAKSLDESIDEVTKQMEQGRVDEANMHNDLIKKATQAQEMAEGQRKLMDAKIENILMQLEAVFRERQMLVYRTVRGRMDYHVKRYRAEARVQQKWMIGWILQKVNKSLTSDFKKQALDTAIADLGTLAGKA